MAARAFSSRIRALAWALIAATGACDYDAVIGKNPHEVQLDDGGAAADGDAPSTSPCAAARCAAGTYCDDSTGRAQCLAYPTCATAGACTDGGRCEDRPIVCVRAPCPPTAPTCVSVATRDAGTTSSCAATLCLAGTYCDESTGQAQCLAYPTCATAGACTDGGRCEDRPIVCVRAPCPPTAPTCVPPTAADAGTTSSCAAALCPTRTYCDDSTGQVQCVPYPTCATVRCAAPARCYDDPIACVRAPCPPTAPVCR